MTFLSLTRHHSKRTTLSGLLVLLWLLQALLLPWLTAPQLEQSADGQWTMMCTLQGLQRVYVESGEPAQPSNKGQHCPACTLAQSVDVPLATTKLASLPSQWQLLSSVAYEHKVVAFQAHLNSHAIRAPPIA